MSDPFTAIRSFSMRPKVIRIADPDDIIESTPQWSAEQLKERDVEQRGAPLNGYKLETKKDALTVEFTVRRLTAAERERCNRILDVVQPPPILEPKHVGPGQPPAMIKTGLDFENQAYLAQRRDAESEQFALMCLMGVEGMMESVEGDDEKQKIDKLRSTVDERIIRILAAEIWGRTYAGGDPADFFTNANS